MTFGARLMGERIVQTGAAPAAAPVEIDCSRREEARGQRESGREKRKSRDDGTMGEWMAAHKTKERKSGMMERKNQ